MRLNEVCWCPRKFTGLIIHRSLLIIRRRFRSHFVCFCSLAGSLKGGELHPILPGRAGFPRGVLECSVRT